MKLRNTNQILTEIESTVEDVKQDYSIKKADLRMRGCKHALQVMALSMMHNRNTEPLKLKHLGIENE